MSSQTREVAGQPDEEPRRETTRFERNQARQGISPDHIRDLINALGDPNHPLHSQAVNDLVDIGQPAVMALSAALAPSYPWLTSYRAAEALAQIGDGRASGALITALRHPNSNVRWSVVRALSEIGDTRTLLALRRVVNEDHGKTSWGESVSDTAQIALDRLQSRSALLRFSEPIKTALVFVAMLAVLAFASSRVQALRSELTRSDTPPPVVAAAPAADATATSEEDAAAALDEETPTPQASAEPSPPPQIVSTVKVASGNVRDRPNVNGRQIGTVYSGDELVFLARNGDWYRVRLGQQRDGRSRIDGDEGWVSAVVVNAPSASIPAEATGTSATATPSR